MKQFLSACLWFGLAMCGWCGTTPDAVKPEEVIFKDGTGLLLGGETRKILGVTLTLVEEKPQQLDHDCTAQIYKEATEVDRHTGERKGYAYARAIVDASVASTLVVGEQVRIHAGGTGSVFRIHTDAQGEPREQMEVLFELSDPDGVWKMGRFETLSWSHFSDSRRAMIPASAVLQTAFGTYAYVQNGEALLRIPIVIGPRHGRDIEVMEGLYDGDEVVRDSVQNLYLVELQASKGGVGCCR